MFTPWVGPMMDHDADHGDHGHAESTSAPATPPPAPQPPQPAERPTAKAPSQDVMGARHILVAYKGAMRARPQITRSKEEAKKRAAEVAGKAKKLGAPDARLDGWKKLVEEYSDEPGAAKRGGDLGRFRAGSFHKDFVAGTEKLKVGEISGPVETPFGFHIIWRTF
jgi:parvulin-like peptidyl-prolyl isomerase